VRSLFKDAGCLSKNGICYIQLEVNFLFTMLKRILKGKKFLEVPGSIQTATNSHPK
jgi:hypothetical protein